MKEFKQWVLGGLLSITIIFGSMALFWTLVIMK